MNYLQNVLKESMSSNEFPTHVFSLTHIALRLYPPLPVNTRTAVRTTVLPTGGGPDRKSPVLIPKRSAVAYSVYSMHRRPDLYGMDAELFRPERWEEDMPLQNNPTDLKWSYLPFNGGPRICLGSELAPLLLQVRSAKSMLICFTLRKWNSLSPKLDTRLYESFKDLGPSSFPRAILWS